MTKEREPRVQYMGLTTFRHLNKQRLRDLKIPALIMASPNEEPVSALVPYALYLRWQELLELSR